MRAVRGGKLKVQPVAHALLAWSDSDRMDEINLLMSRVLAAQRAPTELEYARFIDLVRAEISDEHGVQPDVPPDWVHMASMRFHRFADEPPPWLKPSVKGKEVVGAVGIDLAKCRDGTVDPGPDGNSIVLFKADRLEKRGCNWELLGRKDYARVVEAELAKPANERKFDADKVFDPYTEEGIAYFDRRFKEYAASKGMQWDGSYTGIAMGNSLDYGEISKLTEPAKKYKLAKNAAAGPATIADAGEAAGEAAFNAVMGKGSEQAEAAGKVAAEKAARVEGAVEGAEMTEKEAQLDPCLEYAEAAALLKARGYDPKFKAIRAWAAKHPERRPAFEKMLQECADGGFKGATLEECIPVLCEGCSEEDARELVEAVGGKLMEHGEPLPAGAKAAAPIELQRTWRETFSFVFKTLQSCQHDLPGCPKIAEPRKLLIVANKVGDAFITDEGAAAKWADTAFVCEDGWFRVPESVIDEDDQIHPTHEQAAELERTAFELQSEPSEYKRLLGMMKEPPLKQLLLWVVHLVNDMNNYYKIDTSQSVLDALCFVNNVLYEMQSLLHELTGFQGDSGLAAISSAAYFHVYKWLVDGLANLVAQIGIGPGHHCTDAAMAGYAWLKQFGCQGSYRLPFVQWETLTMPDDGTLAAHDADALKTQVFDNLNLLIMAVHAHPLSRGHGKEVTKAICEEKNSVLSVPWQGIDPSIMTGPQRTWLLHEIMWAIFEQESARRRVRTRKHCLNIPEVFENGPLYRNDGSRVEIKHVLPLTYHMLEAIEFDNVDALRSAIAFTSGKMENLTKDKDWVNVGMQKPWIFNTTGKNMVDDLKTPGFGQSEASLKADRATVAAHAESIATNPSALVSPMSIGEYACRRGAVEIAKWFFSDLRKMAEAEMRRSGISELHLRHHAIYTRMVLECFRQAENGIVDRAILHQLNSPAWSMTKAAWCSLKFTTILYSRAFVVTMILAVLERCFDYGNPFSTASETYAERAKSMFEDVAYQCSLSPTDSPFAPMHALLNTMFPQSMEWTLGEWKIAVGTFIVEILTFCKPTSPFFGVKGPQAAAFVDWVLYGWLDKKECGFEAGPQTPTAADHTVLVRSCVQAACRHHGLCFSKMMLNVLFQSVMNSDVLVINSLLFRMPKRLTQLRTRDEMFHQGVRSSLEEFMLRQLLPDGGERWIQNVILVDALHDAFRECLDDYFDAHLEKTFKDRGVILAKSARNGSDVARWRASVEDRKLFRRREAEAEATERAEELVHAERRAAEAAAQAAAAKQVEQAKKREAAKKAKAAAGEDARERAQQKANSEKAQKEKVLIEEWTEVFANVETHAAKNWQAYLAASGEVEKKKKRKGLYNRFDQFNLLNPEEKAVLSGIKNCQLFQDTYNTYRQTERNEKEEAKAKEKQAMAAMAAEAEALVQQRNTPAAPAAPGPAWFADPASLPTLQDFVSGLPPATPPPELTRKERQKQARAPTAVPPELRAERAKALVQNLWDINAAREAAEKAEGRGGRGGRGGRARGGRGGRGHRAPPPMVVTASSSSSPLPPAPAPEPAYTTLAGFNTGRAVEQTAPQPPPESTIGGQTTCIVCFEQPKTHAAMPCGHQCVCEQCAAVLAECPYCRRSVVHWFNTAQLRIV